MMTLTLGRREEPDLSTRNRKSNASSATTIGSGQRQEHLIIRDEMAFGPWTSVRDFRDLQLIGSGSVSNIFSARCALTNQSVAIKVYHKEMLNEKRAELLRNEIRCLQATAYEPGVCQLYGTWEDDAGCYLVQELCAAGDLLDVIDEAAHEGAPPPEGALVRNVLVPLLVALRSLHARGIIHRDVKPENIFLDAQGCARLGDFGLALDLSRSPAVDQVGTLDYMAPEVLCMHPRLSASTSSTSLSSIADVAPTLCQGPPGVCACTLLAGAAASIRVGSGRGGSDDATTRAERGRDCRGSSGGSSSSDGGGSSSSGRGGEDGYLSGRQSGLPAGGYGLDSITPMSAAGDDLSWLSSAMSSSTLVAGDDRTPMGADGSSSSDSGRSRGGGGDDVSQSDRSSTPAVSESSPTFSESNSSAPASSEDSGAPAKGDDRVNLLRQATEQHSQIPTTAASAHSRACFSHKPGSFREIQWVADGGTPRRPGGVAYSPRMSGKGGASSGKQGGRCGGSSSMLLHHTSGLSRPASCWGARAPRGVTCDSVPHASKRDQYTPQVDAWAVGVTWFEVLTGRSPFTDASCASTCAKILWMELPGVGEGWPAHVSPLAADFIGRALRKVPEERLSVEGMLRHPYVLAYCPELQGGFDGLTDA
eukprot:jgi/Mesvir1/5015/Mv13900-RA.1